MADDLGPLLENLKGFGGYTTTLAIIIGGLLAWWKVLPAFVDAISNRQSKIEERMALLLENATARFTRDIAAADLRHADCMAGQDKLLARIDALEEKSAAQQACIEDQQRTIEGLRRGTAQRQVSAIRTEGQGASPMVERAMQALSQIPEGNE